MAVTSLIEVYNLQQLYRVAADTDVVLASVMQAIADDTCAWVSLRFRIYESRTQRLII